MSSIGQKISRRIDLNASVGTFGGRDHPSTPWFE